MKILKRKAAEIVIDLERDHKSVLITQHRRPSAYWINVDSFEALNQQIAVFVESTASKPLPSSFRILSFCETLSHPQSRARRTSANS